MGSRTLAAGVLAAATLAVLPATGSATDIRVSSTTDTVDAGLAADATKGGAEGPLILQYQAAHPEDKVIYVGVGTGQALQDAQDGKADVVITHAPSLEQQFVAGGFSLGKGRQIFFSDYVIVGPKAGKGAGVVPDTDRHDAVQAYEDIAVAGRAANATFVSRNDNSGTNVAEQRLWGLTPTGKDTTLSDASTNPDVVAAQRVPKPADWYPFPSQATTGLDKIGQAANLQRTEQCATGTFENGGCFTMTDRGSFNRYLNNNPGSNLTIVAEKNTPQATGGENLLVNPFSAYVVNPATSGGSADAVAAAQRFVDFIVSPPFQAFLPSFPSPVDPAFRPDAFPALTVTGLPQTAVAGQQLTLDGTAVNQLPGAGPVNGLPVTLQQSTNGGASWTDVGTATSGPDGRFRATATVAQTAAYRLATPVFAASDYNDLTASAQPIGTVTVPAAATPKPKDTKKPRVSKLRISRRKLTLRVSEAASVKVRIQRIVKQRVKGKRRTTYRTVKRFTLKARKAGTVSRRYHALKRGRYRILVTVTDKAGNTRSGRTKRSVKR